MTTTQARPTAPTAGPDARDPHARLAALLDAGSLHVTAPADRSGVAAGFGRADGRDVMVFCTDPRVSGGALGAAGCGRIAATIDAAVAGDCPVIGVWHSGGARLTEGIGSLDGVGRMFAAMVRASGRVPQITVVVGAAAGGAAYGSALTDVVITAPAGRVFVTGPDVIRAVTGEVVDQESLGGPAAHGRSGVVHVAAGSEAEAFAAARRITGLLAGAAGGPAAGAGPVDVGSMDVGGLLPERRARAYDVRPLVRRLLDAGEWPELQARWAPNVVVGLGRLAGRAVGVVANNPLRMGGCLDSAAAEKAARFVRLCDAFAVPLAVVVDVPGYLPGVDEEWGGVVRRGAKLLHAFAEATVPRVTLVTRKAFGGAYVAMNSRSLGATAVFAWPGAEIAVMGADAAVGILHRRELAAVADGERDALRARLADEHARGAGGLDAAVALGAVDAVIDPVDSRRRLAQALASAPARRGAHANIPL